MSKIIQGGEPEALTKQQTGGSGEKVLWWLFWGAIALFLTCYAIRPIADPDFWWHLKSGELMAQQRGWLHSDPFTFSGDGVVSAREALILKGYWLWQLTAYAFYALLGFNGIFLLNLLILAAMAGVVGWQLRRQQVASALVAILLSLGFYLFSANYSLERPQITSFLFAAILLILLARVREEGGRLGWSLPLLMLLWANVHGGFVVGVLILLCFAAGAGFEYRRDPPRLRHLLLWSGTGIAASFFNPAGGLAFAELLSFQGSILQQGVTEYLSTWETFQQGGHYVVVLWLLIALYALGVWSVRRIYWPEFCVALFLAVFSVAYTRNIGFFAIAMLPVIGDSLYQGSLRLRWQAPAVAAGLSLLLCASTLFYLGFRDFQGQQGVGPVRALYPEQGIAFLQASRLQGRMFNSYEYGGYLLWRLGPDEQVFIDGRGMEEQVFSDCQKIMAASSVPMAGRKEYEVLLDRYGIDYTFQRLYDNNGMIYPLMKELLGNPEWVPLYIDYNVYILVRHSAKNAAAIRALAMDRSEFKGRLLQIYNSLCQAFPQELIFQAGRADLLIFLGRYEEARAQVAALASVAPQHPFLPVLQRDLQLLRRGASGIPD